MLDTHVHNFYVLLKESEKTVIDTSKFTRMKNSKTIDYIGTYFTDQGFDFTGLLNSDFFEAIRLLYQNELYVSASKLLVVAIDSIGYIEYGDVNENTFIKWLYRYANLENIGISAEELWEHRNAILHMSSLDSRKVRSGKIRRLILHVGDIPREVVLDTSEVGYYDLQKLVIEIIESCGRWVETYGVDRDKIVMFIDRYDNVISDNRMAIFNTTSTGRCSL